MAIGGNYNNGNSVENGSTQNKSLYESTFYSRLRIKNQDGKLGLNFSFRSGLLILEINETKNNGNEYKVESLESIYLSPTKAGLLANEIRKFIEYYNSETIDPNKAFGVNAGMSEKVSYIGFHAMQDKTICITIGKIDSNGNIVEKATIALNKQYHYALEWNNINTMDVSKVYYDNTEINQIIDVLDDFSRSMSGALAYSVVDLNRYESSRLLKKLDPIYDKLGIERKFNNGYSSKGTNNFFNNSETKSGYSNKTSIDEIEDLLD